MTVRPCFLVIDREFSGSISSRKLVLETAKFNVITAYSFAEAFATLERFPAVHSVVVSASVQQPCVEFTTEVKRLYPEVKIAATGFAGPAGYGPVDRVVESYSPELLLETMRSLFPAQAARIEMRERELDK